MAQINSCLEPYIPEITITRERYTELIKAEHDADCLKDVILQKAENYQSISLEEVKLLKQLYFTTEKETN